MPVSKEVKNQRNREYRARNRERLRVARASNLDSRYNDLQNRAKRTGRKFKISRNAYKNMIEGGCYYCGASLMEELGGSLDRANNKNRNYTTANVVPCCTRCNNVKSKFLSKDEMLYVMEMLNRLKRGEASAVEISRNVKEAKESVRRGQIRRRRSAAESGGGRLRAGAKRPVGRPRRTK